MMWRVPLAGDSTSLADLSASSRNKGCPSVTWSPSAASHSAISPSVIEKPILGRRISVAMAIDPLERRSGLVPIAGARPDNPDSDLRQPDIVGAMHHLRAGLRGSIAARFDPVLGFAGLVGLAWNLAGGLAQIESDLIRALIDFHSEHRKRPARHHIMADRKDEVHFLGGVEIFGERFPGRVAQIAVVEELVDASEHDP